MRRLAFLVALALCLLPAAAAAQTATSPIPASAYPAHGHGTYLPAVDNPTWDCAWAYSCDDQGDAVQPFLHSALADALGRQSGWLAADARKFRHHGKHAQWVFVTVASAYAPAVSGPPNSALAVQDFGATIASSTVPCPLPPALLASHPTPAGGDPAVLCAREDQGNNHLVLLAVWQGDWDVEEFALSLHNPDATWLVPDAVAQVQAALATLPPGGSDAR